MDNTCNSGEDNCKNKDSDVNHILENEYSRHGMACDYDQKHKLLFIGGGFNPTKKEFCSKSEGGNIIVNIIIFNNNNNIF